MVVLVSGCSNSYGLETQLESEPHTVCPSYAYGSYIAKRLNAEYINIARCGYSNICIAERTMSWIQENCIKNNKYKIDDLLILVGWTESGRYYLSETDLCLTGEAVKQYIANSLENKWLCNVLKKLDPTKQFSSILYNEILDKKEDVISQLFSIIGLDNYLQKLNIKYFTFPTLFIPGIRQYVYLLDLLSKKHNYPFIKQDKLFRLISHFGAGCQAPLKHLNRFGHVRASQWIMEQLEERKII